MDNKNLVDYYWDLLLKIKWSIHDNYGPAYLEPEEYERQIRHLSKLREIKGVCQYDRSAILSTLNLGRKRYYSVQEYLYNAPRREAQKFIGKKNIRKFIFKRDGHKCLKCYSINHLSLDHILPIHIGGLNRLYNLQTLCRSCNSSKGTNIIDYR